MLFANKTAAEKRIELRNAISNGKLLMMPGAHSPSLDQYAWLSVWPNTQKPSQQRRPRA